MWAFGAVVVDFCTKEVSMTMEDALAELGVRDELLSEEERAFLDANGYLPLPGILSAEQVLAL